MTDPDAITEPDSVAPTPDTEPATEPATDTDGSGEAARRRRQLREVEHERDGMAARLDVLERAELARIATTGDVDDPRLLDARDVFGPETDLDALRGDDGALDPEKVRAAIVEGTEGRPHLRADGKPRPPRPNPAQSASGESADRLGSRSAGQAWSDALAGR